MAVLRIPLILAAALSVAVQAGTVQKPVEVAAQVDRHTIAVGDTFRLNIDLGWQDGVSVKPLALGENIGDFAVRDIVYGPISALDSLSARKVSVLLTVFKTGVVTVPPMTVVYMDQDGNAGKAETPAIEIQVESVLPDDAADIRDIRAPLQVPKRWRDIIASWGLLLGLVAAAAGSVLVSMKRREELEAIFRRVWLRVTGPVMRLLRWLMRRLSLVGRDEYGAPSLDARIAEPYLTPEQAALKEFERIDAMRLAEQGKTLELNTLVSEAVRRYLERKFRVLAMESPTSFTMAAIRDRRVSREVLGLIEEVLEETDLVKFAKFRPQEDVESTLTERGRQLVYGTGGDTWRGVREEGVGV
jgi:hypothetical protein